MAKDKRRPLSTDMNDVNLRRDPDILTDEELAKLADSIKRADQSGDNKAM